MGLAQLQRWGKAQLLHDRTGVSRSTPQDLLQPDVNIVHIRRCSPVHPKHIKRHAEELGLGFRAVVPAAPTQGARPAARQLVSALPAGELREWLEDDVTACMEAFGTDLGYEAVRAKLEVLGGTPCPRYHADHVGVRLLVTYCGPGTWYVENRHVKRKWLWSGEGGIAVTHADEEHAVQAGACDLLFLKGHQWASGASYGLGAVHRSPDLAPGEGLRLLLTVDDVVAPQGAGGACGCGEAHHDHHQAREEGDAHRPDASLAA